MNEKNRILLIDDNRTVFRLLEAIVRIHGYHLLYAENGQQGIVMARQERPDLIIATACHDRLIKALRSVPEFPALLTPLTGMERMCVNAGIDLAWFEAQLAAVAAPRPAAAPAADWAAAAP